MALLFHSSKPPVPPSAKVIRHRKTIRLSPSAPGRKSTSVLPIYKAEATCPSRGLAHVDSQPESTYRGISPCRVRGMRGLVLIDPSWIWLWRGVTPGGLVLAITWIGVSLSVPTRTLLPSGTVQIRTTKRRRVHQHGYGPSHLVLLSEEIQICRYGGPRQILLV
jgi:hypothetical protein